MATETKPRLRWRMDTAWRNAGYNPSYKLWDGNKVYARIYCIFSPDSPERRAYYWVVGWDLNIRAYNSLAELGSVKGSYLELWATKMAVEAYLKGHNLI